MCVFVYTYTCAIHIYVRIHIYIYMHMHIYLHNISVIYIYTYLSLSLRNPLALRSESLQFMSLRRSQSWEGQHYAATRFVPKFILRGVKHLTALQCKSQEMSRVRPTERLHTLNHLKGSPRYRFAMCASHQIWQLHSIVFSFQQLFLSTDRSAIGDASLRSGSVLLP